MNNIKFIYLILFLLSASVLCFEIISTRISSVIFVNDYAFIILSLAVLGLSSGCIFSYYRIKENDIDAAARIISRSLILIGISLFIFIASVINLSITNPYIYFILLFLPFFIAGIVYSQLFKIYAGYGFNLYASDLTGAALGSAASFGAFDMFGAPNSILFLAVIIIGLAGILVSGWTSKRKISAFYFVLLFPFVFLLYNGNKELLGRVPIGNFPEKDFYHVYPDLNIRSQIIDSRWSIYGRSDLVQYSHQNAVNQLFIDGAAGTQMYSFNGDVKKAPRLLLDLLVRHSSSIPFLFLKEHEKNSMLIIGPGGGKEVLTGLLNGVDKITGVEINPDFVDIVKEHRNFNGGIYTDFPNVEILVKEGRHFIKQSDQKYDLIVMALPSTEQMQNIEAFAMSENYLVTSEAIQDYLKILTPEGRIIITVHNKWELVRLITTSISAFEETGVGCKDAINHFSILESDYAPTMVIKKTPFILEDIVYWQNIMAKIPRELPAVTFLPDVWSRLGQTDVNRFLMLLSQNDEYLHKYIERYEYDISPCRDDSPYFYKIRKGVPSDYLWLLFGIIIFNYFIVKFPLKLIRKKNNKEGTRAVILPLVVFICIGLGFMMLEVCLFQKLVLYLGSPTISLSILLSSILIGMGIGSFWGDKIYKDNINKRIYTISLLIVAAGTVLFILYPLILTRFLVYSLAFRSFACFLMMLPFGFLLGIPFPSCIQLLKQGSMEKYIPWMYGVNGAMSVLGSVLAAVLSMIFGFTPAFFAGLSLYLIIFVLLRFNLGLQSGKNGGKE